MPIEIRELVIKTEITAQGRNGGFAAKDRQLEKLRKQLLEECRQMLADAGKRNLQKR